MAKFKAKKISLYNTNSYQQVRKSQLTVPSLRQILEPQCYNALVAVLLRSSLDKPRFCVPTLNDWTYVHLARHKQMHFQIFSTIFYRNQTGNHCSIRILTFTLCYPLFAKFSLFGTYPAPYGRAKISSKISLKSLFEISKRPKSP